MTITTRPITEEELSRFLELVERGFGNDPEPDDDSAWAKLLPLDLTVAAFDGEDMVGTLAAFEFEVTVPGGTSVAMPGTTVVTVQPTHRRRGVLTAMMKDHLDEIAERGAPLAGLWASESPIYGRFGFGHATSRDDMEAPSLSVTIDGEVEGRIHSVDPDEVAGLFGPIYETKRLSQPGMLSRSPEWWKHAVLYDPKSQRRGASAKRFVIYEADGAAEGYAIYRQKSDWSEEVPKGQVRVREVIATTERAHTGLWRYLTNIDLFPRVGWWNTPVDDSLWWKLVEPRRLTRKRGDALWVRIMDVPSALEARGYEQDGMIRMDIDDSFRPDTAGVYELAVSDGVGKCVRVEGDADVALGIDVLGALYLGGSNAVSMAAAGLIEGSVESVSLLHRMFHTEVAPWCEEVF